jgi:phosphonate transport system ATP-binding protein
MPLSSVVYQLTDVYKQYSDTVALAAVSLQVTQGERVALVGSSGAGKSTLLRLLNGAEFASAGVVSAFGCDFARSAPRQRRALQRRIGSVYQQLHLVDNLSVIHNVNAGHLGRWSLPRALLSLAHPAQADALSALAQVGIPEKLYTRVDQLSGGQQQRVALARVLVQNPDVILADEPVSSLDPRRGADIMQLLVGISQQLDKTLIASLHAVDYVFEYFDRAIGLKHGRIVFDTAVAALTRPMLEQLYQD